MPLAVQLPVESRGVAKIEYTQWFCCHYRVPFYFNNRNSPRTPPHWPTPATTRSWPHFHRVCPMLAIQLAKGTRFSCPLPDNGHKHTGSLTNSPHTRHPRFMFSAIDMFSVIDGDGLLSTCSQLSMATAFFQIDFLVYDLVYY